MNNIGGPKSSGRVRGSGVGAAGGSSRPLLSQLPLSPLVMVNQQGRPHRGHILRSDLSTQADI